MLHYSVNLTIQQILKIAEPFLDSTPRDIHLQKGGVSSRTHRITTKNNTNYFFKENTDNHTLELELTEKMLSLGVQLPKIIAVDSGWMLMKSLKGVPLKSVSDPLIQQHVLPKAGNMTAIINSQVITGFGPLVTINSAKYSTYVDFYAEHLFRVPASIYSAIDTYLRSVKNSYLCHGDMANSHIFVDSSGEFEALLDIDDVLGGVQHYDLAEFDVGNKRDSEIWEAFIRGYGEILPPPKHDTVELLIEEFLIELDSYLFWEKRTRNKQEDILMKSKMEMLEKLENLISSFSSEQSSK